MSWFSTKIRVVCFIGTHEAIRYADSVHLLEAADFKEAFQKALSVGRSHEEEHLNGDNEWVRWRLKELISLDMLADGIFDGCEVYSEPRPLTGDDLMLAESDLCPEKSLPTQTI